MLLSMTGFGDAQKQTEHLAIAVEVRTVNNRYLKVSVRTPDVYATLDSQIEKLVREKVTRGTVSVTVRARRLGAEDQFEIQQSVLEAYIAQLTRIAERLHIPPPADLSQLLPLPGVIAESDELESARTTDWPLIKETLLVALENLTAFRKREGSDLRSDLQQLCGVIIADLDEIAERAPQVVVEYRDKITQRVNDLLADSGVSVNESDLLRETSVFADRCDINEEITRLRTHVAQFRDVMDRPEPTGRKLEFLCQEMFRETNTIGSKSNDIAIAHRGVEIKAAVEKMREIVQNVE